MRSAFAGIEIGKTALVVSQLGLDLTGHNIANVDTEGYTRQRIVQTAYDPFWNVGRVTPAELAKIGGGVNIKVLDQIRSAYLDRRYRTENALNSYWQKRTEGLRYVESYFDDYAQETSVNYAISEFFRAVKVLSADAVEGAQRTLLRDAGTYLTQQLNSIYDGLTELQSLQNDAVKTTVDNINRIAADIVELNKSIYGYEATGFIANDLRDKRNLLLDELASIIPVEYREESFPIGSGMSKLIVEIGGEVLVDHDKQYKLAVVAETKMIPDATVVWTPVWEDRVFVDSNSPYNPYIGNASTKVALTGIDLTNEWAVKNRIDRINEIAKEFNKLYATMPSSGANAGDSAQLAPPMQYVPGVFTANATTAVADIGNRVDALKAALALDQTNTTIQADLREAEIALSEAQKALKDAAKADALLAELDSYIQHDGSGSVIMIKDCDPTGHHAELEIAGMVFARSAGCNDAGRATVKFGYTEPTGTAKTGEELLVTGGELLAYMQMRDSMDVNVQGIPYYIDLLNNLARSLVTFVNEQHRKGWTDPPDGASLTGINFFYDGPPDYIDNGGDTYEYDEASDSYINSSNSSRFIKYDAQSDSWTDETNAAIDINDFTRDYSRAPEIDKITAKNIRLSDEVIASVYNIACSSVEIVKHGPPEKLQRGNNENMNALYTLFNRNDFSITYVDGSGTTRTVDIGSLDGFATKIRFDLASTLESSKKTADNTNTVLQAIENQRLSVSGVSLDEEMTNLLKYQHAYSGASRVITAMDDALDVLINRTGRVGL